MVISSGWFGLFFRDGAWGDAVELIAPFSAYRAKKIVIEESLRLLENYPEPQRSDAIEYYAKADVAVLEKALEDEHKRSSAIDDKTFKFASSIATALALSSAAVTLTTQLTPALWVKVLVLGLSFLSIAYALIAASFGFAAARPAKTYGIGPRAKVEWHLMGEEEGKSLSLAHALACQEKLNVLKAARNETAFLCLRNSLILTLLAIMTTVAVLTFWNKIPDGAIDGKVVEISL